jgi:Eukaryotic aspartyl protease
MLLWQLAISLVSVTFLNRWPRTHQTLLLFVMLVVRRSAADIGTASPLWDLTGTPTNTSLVHSIGLYDRVHEFVIAVQFGHTAEQTVFSALDTGSHEIWYGSKHANLQFCMQYGNDTGRCYDASKSSTYQWIDDNLDIEYMDGSYATGSHGQDHASISTLFSKCLHSTSFFSAMLTFHEVRNWC